MTDRDYTAELRAAMLETGECPRCHHAPEKHHHNKCHHIETWLGLHQREYRHCDCWLPGPEDWAAGDAWNAFMGRR